MAKRGNGEGSIYQRKSDGKWVGSITLENSKRKVFYGKTRKEVQEKLRVAQNELKQGILVPGSRQTVEQYLGEWLKVHKQLVRPRTYERYEAIIRLHLVPTLGKLPLQKLTAQHLQRLYAEKLESGLSSTTVAAIHNMLHTALDNAIKVSILTRNVCEMVSPPRKVHKEMTPLTLEQVRKLIDAARGHPQEALFTLALATGMRRGELLGLKWQDINLEKGVLQVRRALTRMPTGLGYEETEPKTKKSRRSIVLAPFAIVALMKHQARQLKMKLVAGDAWEEHDYVFCSPIGKHLNPGNDVLVQLKKLLKKAGLPDIRFHDLRHSTATLLLSNGVHPKVVQEILGHSEISMTLDTYSHVLPTMQQEAISKLNEAFKEEDDGGQMEEYGTGSDDIERWG
jgi:integrase